MTSGMPNTAVQLRQVGRMNAFAAELNAPIAHKYGLRYEFVWKDSPLSEESLAARGNLDDRRNRIDRPLRGARLDTYRVSTYPVYTMNVTIALSDDLVARVREIAQSQGTTLNELVRRQLELVAGRPTGEALADEMRKLWAQSAGRSGGKRIRRSDAYDPRRS